MQILLPARITPTIIINMVPPFQFDLMSVPWGEDRTALIQTLQAMVASNLEMGTKSETKEDGLQGSTSRLEQKLDNLNRKISDGTRLVTIVMSRGKFLDGVIYAI